MTDESRKAARERVEHAQRSMEQINADTARILEFTGWLRESAERTEAFAEIYGNSLYEDVEASEYREDGEVSPEVAGEDLPYFAIIEHDSANRRLLREVALIVTKDVDD